MTAAATFDLCPNCGKEWPAQFGAHRCNFQRRYIDNRSIVVEPGAPLLESVTRLTERLEAEACRSAEYADCAGEEPPYRAILQDIDATIGFLKRYRRSMQALAGHTHQWNSDDYCDICHADGRA